MEVEDKRKKELEVGKVYLYGDDIVMVVVYEIATGRLYAIVSLLSGSTQSKMHDSLISLSNEFELLTPIPVKLVIK